MYSVCAWLLSLYFTQHYSYTIHLSVSSVTQSCHGLQHARLSCPSPTPKACSNACLSSQWCHPSISSSVVPFSSCRRSFPASKSFPVSQFFTSGGQSIGVSASASVLPMIYSAYKLNNQGDNIQPWPTPFLIWNQCVVPCPVLTPASWPTYRFLRRQVRCLVFPSL